MAEGLQGIGGVLTAIRRDSPLIHNVTNYVGMDLTANALLAVGASPVMAHACEEVSEMAALARAIVVNIGTLSGPWVQSMRKAIAVATERKIPVVFDPVGVGATKYRTSTARMLLEEGGITVVRGNASEIMALSSDGIRTKGVESTADSAAAVDAAHAVAENFGVTAVVSGAVDYVVNSESAFAIEGGTPLLTKVTGMGCAASAIVAACCAVASDATEASTVAMSLVGRSGELAEQRLEKLATNEQGPGTFRAFFLDALYTIQPADLDLSRRSRRI